MFGLALLAMAVMGSAIGDMEIHKFQEGVDNITISKSGELSSGCRFRMSRRGEGEEGVFCCYGGLCDPDEQSRECREEGDYSVEKNITEGTVGECILELKSKARKDDSGNYIAEFLGGRRENSKQFRLDITEDSGKKAGLHPVMILSLGSLLFGVFVFVVLWKKRKDRLERSNTQDIETGEPNSRREMVTLNADHMGNIKDQNVLQSHVLH